jgi:hypothetical protein
VTACCRATIEKLRKDNAALKEELFLESKFSVTPTDSIAAHRITAMQDEADGLTRKARPCSHLTINLLCHCHAGRGGRPRAQSAPPPLPLR